MPIFKCTKCGCKENTSCCNFHYMVNNGEDPLCSECDPKINKWHNRFKKTIFDGPYMEERHGPLPKQHQHK